MSSACCHDTLDFVSVPGFPSAIRVFALTHSRRIVVQRLPWLISFSLHGNDKKASRAIGVLHCAMSLTDYRLGRKDFLDLRLLARADYKPRLYCVRKTRVEITNDTIQIDVHENIDNNDSYHADRFYGQSE